MPAKILNLAFLDSKIPLVAAGGQDGNIYIKNIHSDQILEVLEYHSSAITGLTISSDKRYLASKSNDNSVCIWDTASWNRISIFGEIAAPNLAKKIQ